MQNNKSSNFLIFLKKWNQFKTELSLKTNQKINGIVGFTKSNDYLPSSTCINSNTCIEPECNWCCKYYQAIENYDLKNSNPLYQERNFNFKKIANPKFNISKSITNIDRLEDIK